MKNVWGVVVVVLLAGFGLTAGADAPKKTAHGHKASKAEPVFTNYADTKWDKMMPDLGADSLSSPWTGLGTSIGWTARRRRPISRSRVDQGFNAR
jgi:hypothetical protein